MKTHNFKKPAPLAEEKLYDVLVAPVVTEKSTLLQGENVVTFYVQKDATKPQIKQAVEHIFGVKVEEVTTLILKGKTKRFRGHVGKRSDLKKAYVQLAKGHSVDMMTGVGK